jgi:MoxR-like ATPase
VLVTAPVKEYIIALASATRSAPELRLGASPRATLHLLRASRAWAALDGRDYVIPDDVQSLAAPVLAHRLLPTPEAMVERIQPERVVAQLIERVPLPKLRGRRGTSDARNRQGADHTGQVLHRRGPDRRAVRYRDTRT